ncbi:MAG TPA: cupredoxin domain-containing protein [Acidimicrobiales bacterium]|nr:cupredoxin domain-containing protein [Acidimicrobiales bacterium]
MATLVGLSLVLTGCTGGSPTSRRQISAVTVGSAAGFEPATVTVDKDDDVVLSVGNSTTRAHGFSIEGYGIREEVESNTPIQVKFKSTKPGTFKIFCQLHETHQVATLVVQ